MNKPGGRHISKEPSASKATGFAVSDAYATRNSVFGVAEMHLSICL